MSRKPVEITADMLEKIEQGAAQGLTEEQVAHSLGIGYSTFQRKKKENKEIGERLKRGKSKGIGQIVNKLFQRAQGFYIEEEKAFMDKGEVVKVKVRKYFPPDLGSMAFFLKNRDPENWKDVRHVEQRNKSAVDKEITESMTAQEAAESYADTLRNGKPQSNVVKLKRRR